MKIFEMSVGAFFIFVALASIFSDRLLAAIRERSIIMLLTFGAVLIAVGLGFN